MAEEEIWDNWEDFADSGEIDRRDELGLSMTNGSRTKNKDKKKQKQNVDSMNKGCSHKDRNNASPQPGIRILQRPVIVHEEDQNRTAYMPQLKILKRPEKSSEEQRSADEKRKRELAQQPVRTLAQREAAYAEARQRIMGIEVNNGNDSNSKPNSNTDTRPENLKRYSKQSKTHHNGHVNDVKRQPKGPSSGKGFRNNR